MKRRKINLIFHVIHLDISESDETQDWSKNDPISVINEFLLSFLITKFYIYKEDIIYIPNNIKIYIEIPNGFSNYLEKIGILNIFPIKNIVLGELKQNIQNNINNINMDGLSLDKETRGIIKNMLGFENKKEDDENREIEKFIRENIGKEYSYHQVQTFIKLFISQYKKFNGKIKFKDSYGKDITTKCISDFVEATKYFTSGGFAKLLMEMKDKQDIDKFDLCLKAYDHDLKDKKFKRLFYVDSNAKKYRIIDLGETNEDTKNKKVDIIYLFDATGSMGRELKAANELVFKIFEDLNKEFEEKKLDFNFGVVFYGDELAGKKKRKDYNYKENGYFDLTSNMNKLKQNISKIKQNGGLGEHADWVAGYDLALNKIKWREGGTRLIIHIADDGAHGEEFSKGDIFPEQGKILIDQIKKCVDEKINIIGFKIIDDPDLTSEQSFEKLREVYNKYKLSIGNNRQFIEIYEFNRKKVNEEFYDLVMEAATETANSTYKYLKQLKYLLDLPNDIEENKRNIEKSKNKNINQEPLLSKSTIIKLNHQQKPEEKKIK